MSLRSPWAVVLSWLLLPAAVTAGPFLCAGYEPAPAAPVAGKAALAAVRQPAHGRVGTLVVFARFADERPEPVPAFAEDLFDVDLPGSFSHFYAAMSWGQLQVEGAVAPRRYSAASPTIAYLAVQPTAPGRYAEFATEVLRQADDDIDFSQFDSDGPDGRPDSGDDDGVVDYLFLELLSTPPGFIVQRADGVAGLGFGTYATADLGHAGRPIAVSGDASHGSLQRQGASLAQAVGAMAHEFGHSLGLPDLYDTSFLEVPGQDPAADGAGIGAWGLMGWGAWGWNGDDGPNALSPWSREQLGWLGRRNERLVTLDADRPGLPLTDLHEGGVVYKVVLGARAVSADEARSDLASGYLVQQEYLLLEYRSRGGVYYNRHLPAEGLLVWHVRPRAGTDDDEQRKLVDLVCADGRYADAGYPFGLRGDAAGGDNLDFWAHDAGYASPHGGNLGDATDPFDGVVHRRFTPDTNPTSRLLTAASTGVVIDAITPRPGGLSADVTLPRWAGTIAEPVHWLGEVRLDGDLTVAPEGGLTILDNTTVRIAGRDRLGSGLDPERCELQVQGSLNLRHAFAFVAGEVWYADATAAAAPVVLAALTTEARWYGLVLTPQAWSRIGLARGGLDIRDAEYGLQTGSPPAQRKGLTLSDYRLEGLFGAQRIDRADLRRDESFQLTVELANWSRRTYQNVSAELVWDTPLVAPDTAPGASGTAPGAVDAGGAGQSVSSAGFSLFPGCATRLRLPALRLAEDAPGGQSLVFTVHLNTEGADSVWRDTLTVMTTGAGSATAVTATGDAPAAQASMSTYPNPCNDRAVVAFHLPAAGPVHLALYSGAGQRVATLVDGALPAGPHRVVWNGTDDAGRPAASGVYLCQLTAGGRRHAARLVLLR